MPLSTSEDQGQFLIAEQISVGWVECSDEAYRYDVGGHNRWASQSLDRTLREKWIRLPSGPES